jgi:hypothetical protein
VTLLSDKQYDDAGRLLSESRNGASGLATLYTYDVRSRMTGTSGPWSESLTYTWGGRAASQQWGTAENVMYVVGATQGRMFEDIRRVVPTHFLLVPGVGAQGGSLQEVCRYGMTRDCGLLVNSSRGIIYASSGEDFAEVAGLKAKELQEQMAEELAKIDLI